jgi:hypothetical protein
MSYQHSPSECTGANLEREALKRFRTLAPFVPKECRIFREPWECSTVLCLDFAACPTHLEITKAKTDELVTAIDELGLSNVIIFRIGRKFIGWNRITLRNFTNP